MLLLLCEIPVKSLGVSVVSFSLPRGAVDETHKRLGSQVRTWWLNFSREPCLTEPKWTMWDRDHKVLVLCDFVCSQRRVSQLHNSWKLTNSWDMESHRVGGCVLPNTNSWVWLCAQFGPGNQLTPQEGLDSSTLEVTEGWTNVDLFIATLLSCCVLRSPSGNSIVLLRDFHPLMWKNSDPWNWRKRLSICLKEILENYHWPCEKGDEPNQKALNWLVKLCSYTLTSGVLSSFGAPGKQSHGSLCGLCMSFFFFLLLILT